MSFFYGQPHSALRTVERGAGLLGGAAHFYRCYTCKDGKEVSVGAIEPQFYAELLQRADAPEHLREAQMDPGKWDSYADDLAELFATKTQAEWCELLEGTDACFAPVIPLDEAKDHPHMKARGAYVEQDGRWHTAPAPRFDRTPIRSRERPGWRRVVAASQGARGARKGEFPMRDCTSSTSTASGSTRYRKHGSGRKPRHGRNDQRISFGTQPMSTSRAARRAFESFSQTSSEERLRAARDPSRDRNRKESSRWSATRWVRRSASRTGRMSGCSPGIAKAIEILAAFAFERQDGPTLHVWEPGYVVGMITPWNWPPTRSPARSSRAATGAHGAQAARSRPSMPIFCRDHARRVPGRVQPAQWRRPGVGEATAAIPTST